jgi:hypothetical protein
MKSILKIVKNDLRRLRVLILLWVLWSSGTINQLFPFGFVGGFSDNEIIFYAIAESIFLGLFLALGAAVVQEKSPTAADDLLQTCSASATQLLVAKCGLLIGLLVVLPASVLLVGLHEPIWFWDPVGHFVISEIGWWLVWSSCCVLFGVALASMTKSFLGYLLGWMCSGFVFIFCKAIFAPAIQPNVYPSRSWAIVHSAWLVTGAFLALASAIAALNQYLSRRAVVTISLLAIALVFAAWIQNYWNWDFTR